MNDADRDRSTRLRWSARGVQADVPPARVQKRRLAAAMRRVIERLVTTVAPEDELRVAAERLEQYAERLEMHPRRTRPEGFSEASTAGDVHGFFDYSPLIGLSNPLSPPLELQEVDGEIRGTARFGTAYEGPPGHVHGGIIAAAFDEVLGMTQSMAGTPGMTGTLVIRYRRPTPLHTELRFSGRVDRVEGRKIFTLAQLHAGERLCAEAEGIFVSVDPDRFASMARATEGSSDTG
ncbi:MAG: PaaI family thioesterase [Myxococcota bacterium]